MLRGLKVLATALVVGLFLGSSVSAISLSSLQKISADSDKIEILVPESGYSFDANILAKNQELIYKATILNDEEYPIRVENLSVNESSYSFLEYSYSGISDGDIIEVGETKDVQVIVRTNSNNTQTVSEDYNLTLSYTQLKPRPDPEDPDDPSSQDDTDSETENPETAAVTIIKTGTAAVISLGAIIFVFVRNKRIRNYVVLFVATSLGVCMLATNAVAQGASTFVIRGKVRFTNTYTVTVNPNEGTYDGELTATRREGESFHIGEVTRSHFEFVEWEINPSNTPDENNNIIIHADTTIKAKWNENTYTLTIKPNGGTYADSSETWSESFRPNETVTISTPEKEGYDFAGWTVEQGNIGQDGSFSGSSITMTEDVTLVANYTIKRLSVSIDPNGGTFNNSTEVYNDTVDWGTEISLANIAREGYRLTGWTWNTDKTKPADTQSITITENTTLVANWEQIRYTLTINPNSGSYNGSTSVYTESSPVNTSVSILTPEKEGYDFKYWSVTEGSIGQEGKFTGDSVTMTENITLVAVYEIKHFTVTLIPNGGTYRGSSETYATTVDWNTDFEIEEITREGHDLTSWTQTVGETATTLNASTQAITILGNTVLEANWQIKTFTVSIDPNGGSFNNSSSVYSDTVNWGTEISLVNTAREGYRLTGWTWNTDKTKAADTQSIIITENTTLVANWEQIRYTLTINPNSGSYNGSTSTIAESYPVNTAVSISTPEKEGYDFKHWSVTEGNIGQEGKFTGNSVTMTENITLVAVFEIKHLTVTVVPNGGTYRGSTDTYTTTVDWNTTFEIEEISRTNYDLNSWTKTVGETSTTLNANTQSITITDNTTLEANWDRNAYILTLNPNGGVYNNSTSVYIESFQPNAVATISTPSKEGHTFTDWSVEAGTIGTGGKFSGSSITMNEDVTLIANYTINNYRVLIDPNGGTYNGRSTSYAVDYPYNTEITMSNASRTHYIFAGWTMSVGSLDSENIFNVTADVTLTAQWTPINHTLTINPNGGDYDSHTSEFSEEIFEGQEVDLLTPTKEHYHFTKWTLGDGTDYTESSVVMNDDIALTANYEIDQVHLTVNPNGGTYNSSAEPYEADIDYGSNVSLLNTNRDGYDLKEWTMYASENSTVEPETEEVTVTEDTTLVADWWSSTFYTLTVEPNGGVYDGSTEASEYQVRSGTKYRMLNATKEAEAFDYWHYTNTDIRMNENEVTVVENTSLTAEYDVVVARIKETGITYSSIMSAHNDAINGQTIELLVDTTEIVTNTKDLTLDLGTHTVTGYLYNTAGGRMRLINGEFNNYTSTVKDEVNPDGAAVVNDGELILGYDDYEDEQTYNKAPLIDNDYIKLVGADRGLIQNGTFYFYDGHIDGDLGIIGGYDGSPWYRTTDSPDHEEYSFVYYYPFVSRLTRDSKDYQRVQLDNSNRAVTRTIDNGAIYYYELQDNINTSAVTGYTIYAVRDFDNSAATDIAANTEIVFDIDGYEVGMGDTITNLGKLTVKDGKTGDEKGIMKVNKVFDNNDGDLTFDGITVQATGSYYILWGSKRCELKNSTLKGNYNIYMVRQPVETLIMDENSRIESQNYNAQYGGTIIMASGDLEISGGNVYGRVRSVLFWDGGHTLTISGGTLTGTVDEDYSSNNATIIMTGGKVVIDETNYMSPAIYSASNFTMTGGEVEVNTTREARGISGQGTIINGKVTVTSSDLATAVGGMTVTGGEFHAIGVGTGEAIGCDGCTVNGEDVIITATTEDGEAAALDGDTTFTAGTATAYSVNGEAFGLHNNVKNSRTLTVNGENAHISATSENNNAFGVRQIDKNVRRSCYSDCGWQNGYVVLNMSAGNITATTNAADKVAVGANITSGTITGGTITGTTYGVGNITNSYGSNITIGTNANPLYNGVDYPAKPVITGGKHAIYSATDVKFYDGLLSAGTDTYIDNENIITAIPDGTQRFVKNKDGGGQDCWLVNGAPYLHVEGYDDHDFYSLSDAYDQVENGGQITVIADKETVAVLPNNTKNITLDLNGHTLEFAQPLPNSGTLKVTDSQTGGKISNSSTEVVINNGTFELAGGTITNDDCTIRNRPGKTVKITGGLIESDEHAICQEWELYVPNAKTEMSGGKISIDSTNAYAVSSWGDFEMTGGEIEVTGTGTVKGVDVFGSASISGGTITANGSDSATIQGVLSSSTSFTGGTITVTGTDNATATGLNGGSYTVNGENAKVIVTTVDGTATGLTSGNSGGTFTRGSVNVTSVNGEAKGHSGGSISINGDNATITAKSTTNNAYGTTQAYAGMSAGTITATAEDTNKIGVGINASNAHVSGGSVYGTTYGIANTSERNLTLTIGDNEKPIYNGLADPETGITYAYKPTIEGGSYGVYNGSVVNFYDGIIKGGLAYIDDENTVKAVPDGTHRVVLDSANTNDCWLDYDETYLHVEGYDVRDFGALGDAYSQVENGGKITVTKDMTTQAVLPDNNKNITIDLAGHKLNYTQTLGNNGTLTITDSVGGGSITNTRTTTINNGGTLTISNGTFTGHDCTVYNEPSRTFNLTGGTLTSDYRTLCNTSNNYGPAIANISGGKIITNGANATAIEYSGVVKMSGGEIEVTGSESANGLHGSYYEITGGKITVTGTGDAPAIAVEMSGKNDNSYIDGANVEIKATTENGMALGAYLNQKLTLTKGKIEAESTNGEAFGVRAYTSVETPVLIIDGDFNLSAKSTNNNAYGASMYKYCGWNYCNYGNLYVEMSAGTISATTQDANKDAIALNITSGLITGGTVNGSTYGIGNISTPYGAEVTLGINEDPIYNGQGVDAKPIIEGGTYGIENSAWINFYDGQIKGGTDAIQNIRHVKEAVDGANMHNETADGKNVKYLVPGEYIAKINGADCTAANPKCYVSIKDAITASRDDDTISLIGDDYIFYTLTVPAGKKFTLDLAGHEIITGNPITNNANMTIINTGSAVTLDYREDYDFITTNEGGKLTIDGVNIKAKKPIKNNGGTVVVKNATFGYDTVQYGITGNGNLTLDNVSITSSNTAVSQSGGAIDITGSQLSATSNALKLTNATGEIKNTSLTASTTYEQSGSNSDIKMSNMTFTGSISGKGGKFAINRATIVGTINNDSSEMEIQKGTISCPEGGYCNPLIKNSGKMTISNKTTITNQGSASGYENGHYTVDTDNNGETIIDDTTITRENRSDYSTALIHVTRGTVTISNSEVRLTDIYNAFGVMCDRGEVTSINTNYNIVGANGGTGLYSRSAEASITMKSGKVNIDADKALGVRAWNGSITLGEPEALDSPNRGTANAAVSKTDPLIYAVGTTYGYAVSMKNGTFNYYDGRLVQNEQGYPAYNWDHDDRAIISNTEYWYEPEAFQDANGHYYYILTYMPE